MFSKHNRSSVRIIWDYIYGVQNLYHIKSDYEEYHIQENQKIV